MTLKRGRQFFQNPGPTNIPDRVLRAMDRPSTDFLNPEFQQVFAECQVGLRKVFKTEHIVLCNNSSGHGAWEAALVNLFSPGDRVLVPETGHFSTSWAVMCRAFGLEVEEMPGDWRHGADPEAIEKRLREDTKGEIKGILIVQNETSTGVASRCKEIGEAIRTTKHPALYLVDTISSLACYDFRMDEWGVDVAITGAQKGLMMPVGLSFTAISPKAMKAAETAKLPRSYWDWRSKITDGRQTNFAGTAAASAYYGLQEALKMIFEEGLDTIFARHHRLAEATRRCVQTWTGNRGPEILCQDPREYSDSVTTVLVPEGVNPEAVRRMALDSFNVSLGGGQSKMAGKTFRIGHLGDLNEPMILGALAAIEMSFKRLDVPHAKGGVDAAMDYLAA